MTSEIAVFLGLCIAHVLWIGLPLVPAVLIYRLFPDTMVGIGGPLAGLTINSTGAFAAYFAVLLLSLPVANKVTDAVAGFQKSYWTVTARVKLVGKNGAPPSSSFLEALSVKTKPEQFYAAASNVTINIPGITPESGSFPHLLFSVQNFGTTSVSFSSDATRFKVNRFSREIHIKDPIEIVQE